MALKILDIFTAYKQDKLPREGGYIVSSFFSPKSIYSKYEIVAYNGVKSIHLTTTGLTFQTDGNKIFVLVEPATYSKKYIEPYCRQGLEQIPHRFSELDVITTRNQTKIMISQDPIITYSAFTVLKPSGGDFAFIFYNLEDVYESMTLFFEKTLNKECQIPKNDALSAGKSIIEKLQNFTIWKE